MRRIDAADSFTAPLVAFNDIFFVTLRRMQAAQWPDDHIPRTDRPVRFANLPVSGAFDGNPKSFTFRLYYTR